MQTESKEFDELKEPLLEENESLKSSIKSMKSEIFVLKQRNQILDDLCKHYAMQYKHIESLKEQLEIYQRYRQNSLNEKQNEIEQLQITIKDLKATNDRLKEKDSELLHIEKEKNKKQSIMIADLLKLKNQYEQVNNIQTIKIDQYKQDINDLKDKCGIFEWVTAQIAEENESLQRVLTNINQETEKNEMNLSLSNLINYRSRSFNIKTLDSVIDKYGDNMSLRSKSFNKAHGSLLQRIRKYSLNKVSILTIKSSQKRTLTVSAFNNGTLDILESKDESFVDDEYDMDSLANLVDEIRKELEEEMEDELEKRIQNEYELKMMKQNIEYSEQIIMLQHEIDRVNGIKRKYDKKRCEYIGFWKRIYKQFQAAPSFNRDCIYLNY